MFNSPYKKSLAARIKKTGERIARERDRNRIEFLKLNPDAGEPDDRLRIEANLELMCEELQRMRDDNHWADKESSPRVWTDEDIEKSVRCISDTQQLLRETKCR